MEAPDDTIPWERRREIGVVRAFGDTFVLSVRAPKRFYGLVPKDGSVWPALAYGFVFDLVVAVLGFAWSRTLGAADFEQSVGPLYPQLEQVLPNAKALVERLMQVSAIGSLVMTPVSFLFNLLVTAGMTWIGLRLARGLTTSFGRIVRMFGYASWIQIFGLLAITGDVFLGLLAFVLVLGFGSYYWLVIVRESQRIDNRRAIVASVYGCLVAVALACVIGVPVFVGLAWFLVSNLPSTPILPK